MLRRVLRQCYSLHRPTVPRLYRRFCSSPSETTAATISIDRSTLYNPPGTLFNFPSFPSLFYYTHSNSRSLFCQSILTTQLLILSSSSTSKASSRFYLIPFNFCIIKIESLTFGFRRF